MKMIDFIVGNVLPDKIDFRPGNKGLDGFVVLGVGRRSTSATLVPQRPWQPWEDVPYEVCLGRKIGEGRRSAGVYLVTPVDASRDEAAYTAKKNEEGKKAEAIRQEAEASKVRAQVMRPKIEAAAARLDTILSRDGQDFLGFSSFDLRDKMRKDSIDVWEEKRIADTIGRIDALDTAFCVKVNESLQQAKVAANATVEGLMTVLHALWAKRDEINKKIHDLHNADGYVIEIAVEGRKLKVNRDFENLVPVLGYHTDRWAESPDGYRPAGSSSYRGYKDLWRPIVDAAVIDTTRAHFGDDLILARREEEELNAEIKRKEEEMNEKKKKAWLAVMEESRDDEIITRTKKEGLDWHRLCYM